MPRYLPAMAFLCFVGCGTQPETIDVSGTVTFAGEPVAGATIVFAPENNTTESLRAAQGETDEQGVYHVATHTGGADYVPGVAPGSYRVTVTKLEVVQDMRTKPKHLLPGKYANVASSGLTAEVTLDGSATFDFALEK